MAKSRAAYPEEFRREAVQMVCGGRTIPDVAVALGVTDQSLRGWVKRDLLERRGRDDGLTVAERDELGELRRKVKRLEQERDLLNEPGPSSAGDRDPVTAYRIVSAEKASGVAVSLACELLKVSRSGDYEWATRAPSDRELSDAWLTERIKQIHAENRDV